MATKNEEKKTETSPNDDTPRRCMSCNHWRRNPHPGDPDAVDFSTGSCGHNGYSKVGPMFGCNGWQKKS